MCAPKNQCGCLSAMGCSLIPCCRQRRHTFGNQNVHFSCNDVCVCASASASLILFIFNRADQATVMALQHSAFTEQSFHCRICRLALDELTRGSLGGEQFHFSLPLTDWFAVCMRFFFVSFDFYYCFFVSAFFSFFCIFLFDSICVRLVCLCHRMHFLLCVISRRRQTPSCIISNFHSIRSPHSTTVFFSCFSSHLIAIILSIAAVIDSFVFRVHYVGRNSIEFQKRVKRTKTKTGLCIADECDDVMALFIWRNHPDYVTWRSPHRICSKRWNAASDKPFWFSSHFHRRSMRFSNNGEQNKMWSLHQTHSDHATEWCT